MSNKKNTGLAGRDVFFKSEAAEEDSLPGQSPDSTSEELSQAQDQKPSDKPEKIVSTFRIFPGTLAKIQAMKIHALEQGDRLNIGDILDEAVLDLYKKKGLNQSR